MQIGGIPVFYQHFPGLVFDQLPLFLRQALPLAATIEERLIDLPVAIRLVISTECIRWFFDAVSEKIAGRLVKIADRVLERFFNEIHDAANSLFEIGNEVLVTDNAHIWMVPEFLAGPIVFDPASDADFEASAPILNGTGDIATVAEKKKNFAIGEVLENFVQEIDVPGGFFDPPGFSHARGEKIAALKKIARRLAGHRPFDGEAGFKGDGAYPGVSSQNPEKECGSAVAAADNENRGRFALHNSIHVD
jgi:hypothetical protein